MRADRRYIDRHRRSGTRAPTLLVGRIHRVVVWLQCSQRHVGIHGVAIHLHLVSFDLAEDEQVRATVTAVRREYGVKTCGLDALADGPAVVPVPHCRAVLAVLGRADEGCVVAGAPFDRGRRW